MSKKRGETALIDMFQRHGNITNLDCKGGYAFIEFATPLEAQSALRESGRVMSDYGEDGRHKDRMIGLFFFFFFFF